MDADRESGVKIATRESLADRVCWLDVTEEEKRYISEHFEPYQQDDLAGMEWIQILKSRHLVDASVRESKLRSTIVGSSNGNGVGIMSYIVKEGGKGRAGFGVLITRDGWEGEGSRSFVFLRNFGEEYVDPAGMKLSSGSVAALITIVQDRSRVLDKSASEQGVTVYGFWRGSKAVSANEGSAVAKLVYWLERLRGKR